MGIKMMEKRIFSLFCVGLFAAASMGLFGNALAEARFRTASAQDQLVALTVRQIAIDPSSSQPVVILADPEKERAVYIWIGPFEASAIHAEMQGTTNRRPLTHDLVEKIMLEADLKVLQVIIRDLNDGIYYATLKVDNGGSTIEIDARPSDSIVMALKFDAPILISETLFADIAVPMTARKDTGTAFGMTFQELTDPLAQAFSFDLDHGILISDVQEGSPAAKAGIQRGDILVEVEGQAVDDVKTLSDLLRGIKVAVRAKVFRKGRFVSLVLPPD